MSDFDIDQLKKTWQQQDVTPRYEQTDILKMLNKKSRNYVKYIFWISAIEFAVMLLLNLYYLFLGQDNTSFMHVLEKIGLKKTENLENNISMIYMFLKVICIVITAFFVIKFYFNYKKINVESNLSKFILQIIKFKRTVNSFILTNVFMLVIFTAVLAIFTLKEISIQEITLNKQTLIGFYVGLVITLLISIVLILVYYKIFYGIIMKRLGKNLEQLKELETNA